MNIWRNWSVATNKQREASRRQLEQQLREREAREARRKRTTLIGSVIGALALVAVIVIVIAVTTGGSGPKKKHHKPAAGPKASPTASSAAPQCGQVQLDTIKAPPATGASVTFDGVTVKGATDLGGSPIVTSHATKKATQLAVKDLVVGKGAVATPTSCVDVQYDGVLYDNGKEFDSSWKRNAPVQFSLNGVVAGFKEGIGGTEGTSAQKAIPPMHVGGRRIIIVPAAMGYGSQASDSIPANSDLVFVVDLLKATAS
jgi:peptidylprolyl isomerase